MTKLNEVVKGVGVKEYDIQLYDDTINNENGGYNSLAESEAI